jgi:tetratricopeptide (TPR) repeat protein
LDKYEYKVRADEIKQLIANGDYAQAAEIADTIDWRRVKSVMMLCTISDLYKINRRYEDARDLLLLAYERRPGGRTICYSLCELSIKTEEFVQAVEYYKEFVQIAPKDPGRYILQYKLYEAQDVSLEERIEVLEELKKRDYREKWAYELAYLYHRIGLATRCVEECDELILWFGEGKYVVKAMELKMLHQPLSPEQQKKYDRRFEPVSDIPEEPAEQDEQQEDISDAIPDESVNTEENPEDTKIYTPVRKDEKPVVDEEYDIQVKPMDMGQYNTMNLQEEIAAGVQEVLEKDGHAQDTVMQSILAPMMEADTESLDYPEIDEVDENDLEETPQSGEIESSEVFFGETGEILQKDLTAETVMAQLKDEMTKDTDGKKAEQIKEYVNAEPPKEMADVLSQESDGQISFVIPEGVNVEKQITGQMNIEDILVEWERMKRENAEKGEEEVRRHVLEQTGDMFTEFEASVRDGLLEKIENSQDADEPQEDTEKETFETETLETETNELEAEVSDDTDGVGEVEELEEIREDFEVEPEEETEEEPEISEEPDAEAEAETEEFESLETEPEPEFSEEPETEEEEPESEETEPELSEEPETEEEEPESEETEAELSEETETKEEETESVQEEEQPESSQPAEPSVERDKAKVRPLTREEKELYAPYIQSKAARRQLVNVIDNISMAAYTGNVILTGEEGTDTITLAKNIVREIKNSDSNFSGRIAKITGKSLNNKNVADTVEQLANGALIIEKATWMSNETEAALYQSLQQENQGIVVIIEDIPRAMDRFLTKHSELLNSFTNRMDVEALNNDTLVEFGRQYAHEREYSIDDFGILALHTRIEERQTLNHAVTVMDVKEIVDKAIKHANKKTMGHFVDILFAKRYDDEDMIILGEKDFS